VDNNILRNAPEKSSANTRELRALELYRTHGRDIERLAAHLYRVPSQDGERSYDVLYGEREECQCNDHQYRGVACVHIIAVGIHKAKSRGATVRALARLEESYHHELMDDDEHQELRDRVLALRRRFG
jgi:hypothetical protein